MRSKLSKVCMFMLALTFICGNAVAAERVVMTSPAKNAAYVVALPGMVNNLEATSFLGSTHTINDGIVIRQSRIENGKIIIPPGGLYVTSRSGNWLPFKGNPFSIAGREYVAINHYSERVVIRNVTFKKNDIIPLDQNKTRGMELTTLDYLSFGLPGQAELVFKLVKTTGNYYGTNLLAFSGDLITDIGENKLNKGTKDPEGFTMITEKSKLGEKIYASNFGSVGRTYVVVESVTPEEVKVREMATDNSANLYATAAKPVVKELAKGESFNIGEAKLEVLDLTKDSIKVKLTDASGSVEKVLGPYNEKSMKWVPMSSPASEPFWILSKNGKVAAHLNVFKEDGPFGGGKASLVGYSGVISITNSSVWEADPRFIATVET